MWIHVATCVMFVLDLQRRNSDFISYRAEFIIKPAKLKNVLCDFQVSDSFSQYPDVLNGSFLILGVIGSHRARQCRLTYQKG